MPIFPGILSLIEWYNKPIMCNHISYTLMLKTDFVACVRH